MMIPKVRHTTATLENISVNKNHKTWFIVFKQLSHKNNSTVFPKPFDFGTYGRHIDPTQFPHNKGFPMKLQNVIVTLNVIDA